MYGAHASYHTSEMCASTYQTQSVQSSELSVVQKYIVTITICKYSVYKRDTVCQGGTDSSN